MTQYCLDVGVRRLNFLPFIPRGSGANHRDDFGLPSLQRRELHRLIRVKRHSLCGRVDVRWLDFNAQVIYVVEPDGRIVVEGAAESMDRVLHQIPDAVTPALLGAQPAGA